MSEVTQETKQKQPTTKKKAKGSAKQKKTEAKKPGTSKTKKKAEAKPEEKQKGKEVVVAPRRSAATTAQTCRKQILAARKRINEGFFDLAVHLKDAYENAWYKEWDKPDGTKYSTFAEYCETELEITYRTGKHLVDIGMVIETFGFTKEALVGIGWSKMAQVARHMLTLNPEKDQDEIQRLLDMAGNMSVAELKDALAEESTEKEVQKLTGSGEPEVKATKAREAKPAVMRLSVKLESLAAETVASALEAAFNEIGTRDVGQALSLICSEWIMQKGAATSMPLKDWIAFLEATYGVKLVVSDAEQEEITVSDTEEVAPEDNGSGGDTEDDEWQKLLNEL